MKHPSIYDKSNQDLFEGIILLIQIAISMMNKRSRLIPHRVKIVVNLLISKWSGKGLMAVKKRMRIYLSQLRKEEQNSPLKMLLRKT
jgi:hypothetical protein